MFQSYLIFSAANSTCHASGTLLSFNNRAAYLCISPSISIGLIEKYAQCFSGVHHRTQALQQAFRVR